MRCNIICPTRLTDQHLIAERRELRMIPPLLALRHERRIPIRRDQPREFKLGTGHMLFWIDKFQYLDLRHQALTEEMVQRGFNPDHSLGIDCELAKSLELYNNWAPTFNACAIIEQRIRSRIEAKFDWYRFWGKHITHEWFLKTYF